EGAREAAQSVGRKRTRDISIGFVDALCDSRFLNACRATLSSYPEARFCFKSSAQSAQVSADVLTADVKIGLRYHCDENPQLESAWLMDDQLVVVCAPSHPLASVEKITIDDLKLADWLDYPKIEPGSGAHINLTESLLFRGVGGWNSMPLDSLYARIKLVKGGFGVALLRRASVRDLLMEERLIAIDSPIPESIPVYLTWRRGDYLGQIADAFIEEISRGASRSVTRSPASDAGMPHSH
ncbi:MAG: hypothetical protein JF604_23510, partial [Bradyrhizobium sp.]|nr:hypothetical protein [Bradyrhizobium sp.]